jgi:hypothetical protein
MGWNKAAGNSIKPLGDNWGYEARPSWHTAAAHLAIGGRGWAFNSSEIQRLYEADDYPLRNAASSKRTRLSCARATHLATTRTTYQKVFQNERTFRSRKRPTALAAGNFLF